ncbi:hypothetical protein SKAU_G00206490 [Synaphobranchus kaupii]|uniref:Uncharacterized protein n=1 Tax=Synaphobranchus kaupii TaxID=118154 RepID=A0A9Q1FGH2_SYNKA|nr:hypothetical protein SKAU_G00206490 [Synaphobranchus kaupii]
MPRGTALRGTLPVLLVLLISACTADELQGESPTFSNNTPESISSDTALVNPRNSWLVFKRNSNKGDNKRIKSPKKTSKHGIPGPPGPPGPQGPPGPAAPSPLEQDDLLKELRLRMKEVAVTTGPLEGFNQCQTQSSSSREDRTLTGAADATQPPFLGLPAHCQPAHRVRRRATQVCCPATGLCDGLCLHRVPLSQQHVSGSHVRIGDSGGVFSILVTGNTVSAGR